MNYQQIGPPEENGAQAQGLVPAGQSIPARRDPYAAIGTYGGPGEGGDADFQIDLLEYVRVLVKRRWLILSIVATALVLGVLITLMQTPLYTSTVRLQIDRSVAKIVEGGNITPIEGPDYEFMKTQYELLEGRTMAERVASTLKLGEDADFFKPRDFSLIGFLMGLLRFNHPAPCSRAPAIRSIWKPRPPAWCSATVPSGRSPDRVWSISPIPIRTPRARSGSRPPTPMHSSPQISTSASKPIPTPRRFLKTSSAN